MADPTAFVPCECDLTRTGAGRSCRSLQDLLDAVLEMPDPVLVHHMMRAALVDRFDPPEFPNDFATWCWQALREHALSETLGLIDPYLAASPAELRREVAEPIERHLHGLEHVATCDTGCELHLEASRLIVHRAGPPITDIGELATAMPTLSTRAIFLHVHEARRRTQGRTDDFTAWLEASDGPADLIRAIRRLDFHFLRLGQLRDTLATLTADAARAVGVA